MTVAAFLLLVTYMAIFPSARFAPRILLFVCSMTHRQRAPPFFAVLSLLK